MVVKNYYKILDLETSHVSIDEIKREEIFRKREVHPKLFPFFRDTSPCVDIRASLLVDFVLRVQK